MASIVRSGVQSRLVQTVFILATTGIYVQIFFSLYDQIGPAVSALAVLPVAVAGAAWGLRAGLVAGLLGIVLNSVLFNLVEPSLGYYAALRGDRIPGMILLALMGLGIGRLRDLSIRLKRQLAELMTLSAINQALISTLDGQELLTIILDHTLHLLKAEAASVVLHDKNRNDLWFTTAMGEYSEHVQGRRLAFGQGIAGWVVQHGKPALVPDVSQDPRSFSKKVDKESGFTTRSILCVPLQTKGQTIGAIEAMNKVGEPFNQDDLRLLTSLAATAAAAVENARLYEQARQLLVERQQAEESRAKLEEQFRQSQKMEAIGRLAGGMAHDFNNMLTAIMGYAGLALNALPPDDPVRSDLEGIQKVSHRAADLIRQLLTFARRQVTEPRVFNLNDLILSMDTMLRRLFTAEIELITSPAPELGQIKADPNQIEQVLLNLAVNARDAMPDGGQLILETANITLDQEQVRQEAEMSPGEYVMLTVSDTGHGMTEEIKAHLFEPFFTTKEVGEGTGLGLATCFGIVKQSGGHIQVFSEPGQGTTFKIYLPQFEQVADPLPDYHYEINDWPRGAETVLLAEDEPSLRSSVGRALCEQGYTVLAAANGTEALQVTKSQLEKEIDLLLTDVVMPQMGGTELAEQLREAYPGIKVLFMSGYTDRDIVPDKMPISGSAFLQKPFSPKKLVWKVRDLLDGGEEG